MCPFYLEMDGAVFQKTLQHYIIRTYTIKVECLNTKQNLKHQTKPKKILFCVACVDQSPSHYSSILNSS